MDEHNVGLPSEIDEERAVTYRFDAMHLSIQDDGYMYLIGFADDEFKPSRYVVLQRAHEQDEQDKKLGMDRIHIQVEDESRSRYGGIRAIKVEGGKICILLTDSAQSSLKVDGDIEIRVDSGHTAFEQVVSELKRFAEADGIAFEN